MKTARRWVASVCFLCLAAETAFAADWHVATNGNDSADGTTWATAKLTIQAAVDAAGDGDTVWASNGVYATGGRVGYGSLLTNRVVLNKFITLRSVNGPEVTIILGAGPKGDAAVRCVNIGAGATLQGFTLSQGATRTDSAIQNHCGGGVYGESTGRLNQCILAGNQAQYGGGAQGVTLDDCLLVSNSASSSASGGGAFGCNLNRCILKNNFGGYGGGAYGGTLNDCLIVDNNGVDGGGVDQGTLNNCTVVSNISGHGGGALGCTLNSCIIYGNSATPSLVGCTLSSCYTNDPHFLDPEGGNYRLAVTSPCIDAGNNDDVQETLDLDGVARIENGTVDIGAYEYSFILGIGEKTKYVPCSAAAGLMLDVSAALPWTAAADVPWLLITAGEAGTTNGTITYNVGSNTNTSPRTGAIIVTGGELARTCTVVQAAFLPVLVIAPESTNLVCAAASGQLIAVTANVSWAATTNMPWLSITSGESGTTNGTVVFNVESNAGFTARTGTIMVSGYGLTRSCTVLQAAREAVLTLIPPGTTLPYGATADVAIGVTANISWTAATNVSWLTITSGESGCSNGVVVFSAAANEGATRRIGGIVLTGGGLVRTCTVVQAYEGQVNGGYEAWAADITNGLTGPIECATGDGAPNLLKYATGSSATQADDFPFLVGIWSNRVRKFSFYRNTNAWDVTIYIQRSSGITNGASWSNIATNAYGSWNGTTNVSENGSGNPVSCLYQDSEPLTTNCYLRLKATWP